MQVYKTNPELFIQKANILKALAHPQRLCIIQKLCHTDCISVTDMQDCLGEVQPTVSQHLSKLKAARIIIGRREGTTIYYSMYDEETKRIIKGLIDEIFSE